MKISNLKSLIKQAEKMVTEYKGIEVCFNMHAGSNYILDTEDDDVIDVARTEEDAIEWIKGMNQEGYNTCYYKPIIIDSDTGERVTRETIDNYEKQN